MTLTSKRQIFDPSCPSGGSWYACGAGTTEFVGCCASDPCSITCAQGNIRPGSFDADYYGEFPDATCGDGSDFFTCTAGPFWGCCKSNPCQQGGKCPDGDLTPAFLGGRPDLMSAYGAMPSSSPTSIDEPTAAATSSPPVLTTGTTEPSKSVSQTENAGMSPTQSAFLVTVTPEPSKKPIATIAGGAAGGAVALLAIIGIFLYYLLHSRKSRNQHNEAVERRTSSFPPPSIKKPYISHYSPGETPSPPPPMYTSTDASVHPYPQSAVYPSYAYHVYDPQELRTANTPAPATTFAPVPIPSPYTPYQHRRGISELSGDTGRVECESPYGSPQFHSGEYVSSHVGDADGIRVWGHEDR